MSGRIIFFSLIALALTLGGAYFAWRHLLSRTKTCPGRALSWQAKSKPASRVYWLTHETNEAARALYDKIATRTGFIHYKQVI